MARVVGAVRELVHRAVSGDSDEESVNAGRRLGVKAGDHDREADYEGGGESAEKSPAGGSHAKSVLALHGGDKPESPKMR
jgi:hypothetical protein